MFKIRLLQNEELFFLGVGDDFSGIHARQRRGFVRE